MHRNNFCIINENIPRRHNPTNSQFLRQVMHEEEKIRQVRAQEILMTAENPMLKEQKQSEQICGELKKLEREKFLAEKHRVLLHQNEDQIRELDVQIKRAFVQRELVDQKIFKKNKLNEDLEARLKANKRYLEELKRNKEVALEEERTNAQKKNDFRQELIKQMQDREKQREEEKEMTNKEREKRKRLLEKIRIDIESDKQDVVKMKELLRKERDEYLEKLELFKMQQQLDESEGRRKYLEWLKQRDEQLRIRREKRKQAMREKEALSENIGKQIVQIQIDKQKRQDILLELLIGERLAKDDERHQLKLDKQDHQAKTLRDDFLNYFTQKKQEELSNRKAEQLTYQKDLQAYKELAKKDAEKKSAQKIKNKNYRNDLLETIEHQKWQREYEAAQNKRFLEQNIALQRKRQQEVEEERLRLLKAQPSDIFKYLPRKAIKTEYRSILGLPEMK